ncbi:hypothetical protein [Enterococcus cecorum]|uniref:hypothetical protein n=1 Tax=Enterococcus cecorum TaxID=44008 RepID=UPI00326726E7
MKMIDVLNMVAKGEIKDQTTLKIHDPVNTLYTYTFNGKYKSFYSNTEYSRELGNYFKINDNFLNAEVELIPPKPKKYLVKVNIQGLHEDFAYLNYSELQSYVVIDSKFDFERCRTHFTKKEMQSIKPVREFLEDMEGKYTLIEVEDNEID